MAGAGVGLGAGWGVSGATGASAAGSPMSVGTSATVKPDFSSIWACSVMSLSRSAWTLAARSASLMSVPRPGPSSTSSAGSGAPIICHTLAAHRPISSPNIWLISGAVMKSPRIPNGSRVM